MEAHSAHTNHTHIAHRSQQPHTNTNTTQRGQCCRQCCVPQSFCVGQCRSRCAHSMRCKSLHNFIMDKTFILMAIFFAGVVVLFSFHCHHLHFRNARNASILDLWGISDLSHTQTHTHGHYVTMEPSLTGGAELWCSIWSACESEWKHLAAVPKRTVDPTPININHDCTLYAFAMECKCVHLSILDQLSSPCPLDIGMWGPYGVCEL